MTQTTKICAKCKEEKLLDEFYLVWVKKRAVYTRMSHCKVCRKASCAEWHKNPVAGNKKIGRPKTLNPKPPKKRIYQKKERKQPQTKEQRDAKRRERERLRRESPSFRAISSVSRAIRYVIKKDRKAWTNFVDFSPDDLIKHLESQFTEGMSWKNYGFRGWHIDHIKPVASFNITSSDCKDFKDCWSLSNLRPLWAKDNISKGSRWEGKIHKYTKEARPPALAD